MLAGIIFPLFFISFFTFFGYFYCIFYLQTCAVQTAAGRVLVEKLEKRAVRELRTDIHINGIHVSEVNYDGLASCVSKL